MNPGENQAVFLSYASQDAEAARRIAEALRATGVEVWFDQNELTGGDAWDAKIRGQVKSCALFVPIISAATQARREGYFRLEWKMADDRTHLMAKGTPFLVPVCIDETRDAEALVPDSFLTVQWTRLRPAGFGGQARPGSTDSDRLAPDDAGLAAFCARVKVLLEGDVGSRTPPAAPKSMRPGTAAVPGKTRRWIAPALAALVVIVALALWQPWKATPAAATTRSESRPPASSASTLNDKSIAVLPFENMSEDREKSAFFADGIHEDILTNLSLIKDLRVVSRTSVMQYRGQKKPIPQIARELGVSYVLEGSVRRAGKQVRVSGKLIKAATDEPVWANAYNRDSTDALTIQAGVALEIAGALRTVLSPGEKAALEQRATQNVEAYDLLLKAREIKNGPISAHLGNLPKVQELLERAVELDPKFASAWVELVFVRAMRFHAGAGDDRRNPVHRASALAALETAQRLIPDAVEIVKARGEVLYRCERDFAGAAKEWEKIPRLYPNDPEGWYSMAIVFRRLGRWPESVENFRRVAQLDPANLRNLEDLNSTLQAGRRFDEALAIARRIVALGSADNLEFAYEHARVSFLASGSTKELDAFFARLGPPNLEYASDRWIRREHAIMRGKQEEALRLTKDPWPTEGRRRFARARDDALVFAAAGDQAAVAERAGRIMPELAKAIEQQPDDAILLFYVGALHAFLGHREEAMTHARRAIEIVSEKDDAVWGPQYSVYRATTLAWAGNKDAAIAELARLLRVPYGSQVSLLRTSLWYHPLRGDPRFEALLSDPKNNAPLF